MTGSWANAYVGIPYRDKGRDAAGCDCWGLVRLVLAARACIVVPSYDEDYPSADERAEIASVVAREVASPRWQKIDGQLCELDVLFFRIGRLDSHAGIYLQPGLMLHMVEEDCAKIERYDAPQWSHRLTGVYRWTGAPS